MIGLRALLAGIVMLCACAAQAQTEPLGRADLAPFIVPPMSLGEPLNDRGVWQLLNSGGAEAGFVFETEPMAPLPGFSGASINLLVVLDLDGRFLDVKLISHNEPIFVSGLPEVQFHKFFEQYRGHSISDTLVVGTPYGEAAGGTGLVYLDGVTKATASVRIAHESVLAAALQVAREKMQGIATGPPAFPTPDYAEDLSWQDLVDQGLAAHKRVTNAEIDALFDGTVWEDDDPEAQDYPQEPYLDLWLVDIGAPSIAEAVLAPSGLRDLKSFLAISESDEPILLIETARHGLVSEQFVRNTAPDWIGASQDGFPVALRDADLLVDLHHDLPRELRNGTAMILRTDRRLGFDPTRDWTLEVKSVREHGMFQPQIGSVTIEVPHVTDARFYTRPGVVEKIPPWLEALRGRQSDLIVLAAGLAGLLALLAFALRPLAAHRHFTPIRLGILAVMTGFVGWWGQGQLSIVTPLAAIRTAVTGGSWNFLIYDPFSLLVWAAAILGFVLWGRALFCGWLCPFGALQEFAHHIGRALRLPRIEPGRVWDNRLKWIKYVLLAGLVLSIFTVPDRTEKLAEVEPFKTAITTLFVREWYYVAYAGFWLVFGMVTFKGFCRYVCPLGAVMAIGGLIRGRDWIARRAECGTPCQLCRVKCNYGSIKRSGAVDYSECFGCLDCVTIHDDPAQCVPLIIAARNGKGTRAPARGAAAK